MQPRVGGVTSSSATTVAPARPPGKEGPHLPWTGSMAGPEFPLTYMPFMEHLLNTLARSFGDMMALPLADKLAFVENSEKQARMVRLVESSLRYDTCMSCTKYHTDSTTVSPSGVFLTLCLSAHEGRAGHYFSPGMSISRRIQLVYTR